MIVYWLMWSITTVCDSMSKQFSEEKVEIMSVFPAMVGGLSIDVLFGTVRRALTVAELSGSDSRDDHQAGEFRAYCGVFGGSTAG